jgi:filamentous hemagglutinin family protein
MSNSPNHKQNNSKSSSLTKGFIALFGLAALGGGTYTLYTVIKNQNNPVINVQGSQATAKAGDNNLTLVNSSQNASTKDISTANLTSPTASPTPASVKIVDTDVESKWILKFPLYRMDKDKCNFVGFNSVTLQSSRGGGFNYRAEQNVYGYTSIQGSITSSGKANLSFSAQNGVVVTFESNSESALAAREMVITGTTTALNCPPSTFELRKQS